ncbi:MAG: hypothetical protein M3N53_08395 [Actinomycetota bacterium]|nr:hypothetical protein [Actinomycetota bacterium]
MDRRTRTAPRVALVVVVSALAAILLVSMMTGTAVAQKDPYGNGKPKVLPTRLDRDKGTPNEEPTVRGIRFSDDGAEALPASEAQPGVLPFTGGDVAIFVLVAAGLIGAGSVVTARSRRQRDEA